MNSFIRNYTHTHRKELVDIMKTKDKSNNKLVEVEFNGQIVLATRDGEGTVWVPLRRLCENIGINRRPQERRLQKNEVVRWGLKALSASDGNLYHYLSLHLDDLRFWLATIESSRVKESVRPRLIQYQKECSKVLNDYFTKGVAVNYRFSDDDIRNELEKQLSERGTTYNNIFKDVGFRNTGTEVCTIKDATKFLGCKGAPKALKDTYKVLVKADGPNETGWIINPDVTNPDEAIKIHKAVFTTKYGTKKVNYQPYLTPEGVMRLKKLLALQN